MAASYGTEDLLDIQKTSVKNYVLSAGYDMPNKLTVLR